MRYLSVGLKAFAQFFPCAMSWLKARSDAKRLKLLIMVVLVGYFELMIVFGDLDSKTIEHHLDIQRALITEIAD